MSIKHVEIPGSALGILCKANSEHKALITLLRINPSLTSKEDTPSEVNKVYQYLSNFTLTLSIYTTQDLERFPKENLNILHQIPSELNIPQKFTMHLSLVLCILGKL